ncbi:MAG: trypsin-like peptidase domain-containing protein [Bacteriovoracaceae bacterium]|nr:trypsin-like peptidase domain-containing protein [Bacteriovoracaceae bacterium]
MIPLPNTNWKTKSRTLRRFQNLPPANLTKDQVMINETIQHSTNKLLVKVRPCVVSVISYSAAPLRHNGEFFGKILDPHKVGNKLISSGIIVGKSGHIITAYDAVPANQIEVKLFRHVPNVFKAQIQKVDKNLHLALLKIVDPGNFPVCNLGNSSVLNVGDLVYAVGSPYGFSQTVTSGIISSNRKKMNVHGDIFQKLIQTDAAINKGNNGGPLVNIRGEVIGINAIVYSTNAGNAGINFAIPVNDVKTLLQK